MILNIKTDNIWQGRHLKYKILDIQNAILDINNSNWNISKMQNMQKIQNIQNAILDIQFWIPKLNFDIQNWVNFGYPKIN